MPIRPRWHDALFPEARSHPELFAPPAPGNAMLRAYLNRSNIQQVTRGALILFYRSQDRRAVTAAGVVDDVLRSSDPVEIRRFVGLRTVYSDAEVAELCAGERSVLAVLFRHDRSLRDGWPLDELIEAESTPTFSGGGPTGGMRALSWLDATDSGDPRQLHRYYRHRGVLSEQDVVGRARASQKSGAQRVTALLFSRTEVFPQAVSLARARTLDARMRKAGFFQTMQETDEVSALAFYREAIKRDD